MSVVLMTKLEYIIINIIIIIKKSSFSNILAYSVIVHDAWVLLLLLRLKKLQAFNYIPSQTSKGINNHKWLSY